MRIVLPKNASTPMSTTATWVILYVEERRVAERDRDAVAVQERQRVAAEEERDEQRARDDELDVLADEEHAELHARVLDEVAGDDLALALGLIERHALRLGDERREEEEERERLDEDAPRVLALPLDHRGRAARCRRP